MQIKFGLQRQAIHNDGISSNPDASSTASGTSRSTTIPATGASGAQNREQGQRKRLLELSSGPTPNDIDGINSSSSISYQIPTSQTYTTSTFPSHGQEISLPLVSRSATVDEEQQKVVDVSPQPPSSMQLPPSFSKEYWGQGDNTTATSTSTAGADYQSQKHDSTVNSSAPFTPQHPPPSHSTGAPASLNPPQHSNSGTWRRRLTKTRSLTTMASSVKRSLSTPNVQHAAAAAAEVVSRMSDPQYTDKRRNKLGYHRTSVACGHCRRRKIRCLPAKDDDQGRCTNCIRLKKDCNFYPVEATDRRPRSMSKPDISSSQEPASGASSPSPGAGVPLSSTEPPRGYPASVPVTPTYDFGSSFDDSFRSNSISSATGQAPLPRSANVSRKSSLAKMHAMPLALKIEQGYLSPCDGLHRALWEQSESTTPVSDQFRTTLEDTSAAFWRLTSSTPFLATHSNPEAMDSLTSLDSVDLHDETVWQSQVPSRMGSIDQGMVPVPVYALGSYQSEQDFNNVPGLMSASASTASLTASISEVSSQYAGMGGEGGDGSGLGQFTNRWEGSDPSGGHGSYELESPMKVEPFDPLESSNSFFMDEESPYPFPPQHLHPNVTCMR